MPRPSRPVCVQQAAQTRSPQATLQALQQEPNGTADGKSPRCQQTARLRSVLHVAGQLPALSVQAIQRQHSTSPAVPRACPVASRRSSNCSG